MSKRLGVFGGMFDPVHAGHIQAARHACELLSLDQVRLVPCATPNHRDPARASAAHRLQMLRLATASEPGLEVDTIEIERPGVSYTVDTLAALRDAGSADQIVFILGEDAFNSLPGWHQWRRLFEFCHLLVLGRGDGENKEETGEDLVLAARIEREGRLVGSAQELFADKAGNILRDREFALNVSSTEVRKALRENSEVDPWLDARVASYIHEHGLYEAGIKQGETEY